MTDRRSDDATATDPAEAARRSEDAGIADESAAYTDAIEREKGDKASDESAAHPS